MGYQNIYGRVRSSERRRYLVDIQVSRFFPEFLFLLVSSNVNHDQKCAQLLKKSLSYCVAALLRNFQCQALGSLTDVCFLQYH